MIDFVKGNLFDSHAEALVNTVNTVGVMGKGIALQFKKRFPINYVKYRELCNRDMLHVGQLLITREVDYADKVKMIINFPTKKHWRNPSEYEYIEKGLKKLRFAITSRNIKYIAIPALGCSNGGLDWKVVKQMIITELKDLDCCIYVYEPMEN